MINMPMKKTKKRVMKLLPIEKTIYLTGVLCLLSLFVTKIFVGTKISNLKMNQEKLNYKIESQQKKNESLTMQVNELTSYENVNGVIKEMGLAYNNENIYIIND